MSDTTLHMENVTTGYGGFGLRTNWAAIWAGMFAFAAIWITFEMLGVAIFNGWGGVWGLGTWTIILSIVSMYIAGLQTGRLSGAASKHEGMIHGLIMFGLSMVGLLVMVALTDAATAASVSAASGIGVPSTTGFFRLLGPGAEWAEWIALFLSFCGALAGGYAGAGRVTAEARVREPLAPATPMRPAA